jgi:hypothetical protein
LVQQPVKQTSSATRAVVAILQLQKRHVRCCFFGRTTAATSNEQAADPCAPLGMTSGRHSLFQHPFSFRNLPLGDATLSYLSSRARGAERKDLSSQHIFVA